MQKAPEVKSEEPREPVHAKTRRNKRPTECQDLRRDGNHCGICGSGNVVTQGVVQCKVCKKVEEFLYDGVGRKSLFIPITSCGHAATWRLWRNNEDSSVGHCLDCGAVYGPLCPSCHHHAWGKGMRVYCRCGFVGERKVDPVKP